MDDKRLDALERKLDTVIDKLETLVRLEERHDGAVKRIDRQESRLDVHDTRIAVLEVDGKSTTTSTNFLERAAWVVFSAMIAALVYFGRK